jgi:predicted metallo-beta-lactamase superfamily hydrolase
MQIKIIGTESLGVRGLCCVIETGNRKIVIDPGVALGYQRFGLLPHPFQVAVGERIRWEIIEHIKDSTDIVIAISMVTIVLWSRQIHISLQLLK